jgi:hypothetical protein
MDKTRRGFLKTLGASAGAAVAVVAPAGPRVEEEVVKVKKYEHEIVKVEHFLTRGDGTQDGDLATIMVDGHYRPHVLRNGKWRRQFAD